MMKKLAIVSICLLLILAAALPVYGAENPARLEDQADLLTGAEERHLAGELDRIWDVYGVDVVIVTVPALSGYSATAYADDFYDTQGYGPDGILLLISISDREYAISTAGSCIRAFSDGDLYDMEGQILADLSDGQYFDAFCIFVELTEEQLAQAESGSSFHLVRNLLIALAVGFVVALIVTAVMKGQLKTVGFRSAGQYVKAGSMKLTQSRDLFLYAHVSKQKKEKSSSGGSSTHVSSSGRSHGGRSGRF